MPIQSPFGSERPFLGISSFRSGGINDLARSIIREGYIDIRFTFSRSHITDSTSTGLVLSANS